MRRTKIIATLGPATDGPETLAALVEAGVDVVRLNTAHASRETLGRQLTGVREAAGRARRHVGVMLDLGGAKIRLGVVAPGTTLQEGAIFDLRADDALGDATGAAISHRALADDVAVGDRILIDDGRIELVVAGVSGTTVRTTVQVGGPLSSRKGVNVPDVTLSVEGFTEQDRENLVWGLDSGVDLIAQSFVRCAADVERLRAAMGDRQVPVIAKIEKHEALGDLSGIVAAADMVMVARGDLGVETSPEEVPVAQRRIVAECRATGTPVIVATQMLESMTTAASPTRAEASDVANAIFDGVDAVMLSGETAVGTRPVHVLATMDRIVRAAEAAGVDEMAPVPYRGRDVGAAVSRAACDLAEDLELAAIVTVTQSGATARSVAVHRPRVPILAATPEEAVARSLAAVWGVQPVIIGSYETTDELVGAALHAAVASGVARTGDRVAVTGGAAMHVAGSTDFVQVSTV
ncbi:MAG: pyruvate kinase [Coriobacteriia bacterium]|nr:pyruvate kinase [Coriobacteriia bacterium]